MNRDTHGLTAGARVVEANADVTIVGTITSLDNDGSCVVRWDNGHTSFDTDIDDLIPVGGW